MTETVRAERDGAGLFDAGADRDADADAGITGWRDDEEVTVRETERDCTNMPDMNDAENPAVVTLCKARMGTVKYRVNIHKRRVHLDFLMRIVPRPPLYMGGRSNY